MTDFAGTVGAGLLQRFRSAGAEIQWRDAAPAGRARRAGRASEHVRIAHLHDEEARVEESGRGKQHRVAVDAGPLGALVILLEVDRRGLPSALGAAEGGKETGFPSGAIVAAWGGASVPLDSVPTLHDLCELARYALA